MQLGHEGYTGLMVGAQFLRSPWTLTRVLLDRDSNNRPPIHTQHNNTITGLVFFGTMDSKQPSGVQETESMEGVDGCLPMQFWRCGCGEGEDDEDQQEAASAAAKKGSH